MSNRNSRLILAKGIKLNKKYTEVLSYSEKEMITLLRSNAHLLSETSNFSFLRPYNNKINVDLPINIVMQSNYMAFQNPDFSNKWYFAFIEERKYISDKTTEITYTIDYFSTWFDYWNPKTCFILRQHAINDTVGANLVDESLDVGEYTQNGLWQHWEDLDTFTTYVQVSSKSDNDAPGLSNRGGVNINSTIVLDDVKRCDNTSDLAQMITDAGVSTREVLNAWLVPTAIMSPKKANNQLEDFSPVRHLPDISVSRPGTLDSYSPSNNKLLTFPFIWLNLSNNGGKSSILKYEEFTGSRLIGLEMITTVGCPGIAFPKNYKGNNNNYAYGVSTTKYPVVPYSSDGYQAWLNSESFANKMGTGVSALQFGLGAGIGTLGILTGNLGLMGAGAGAISSSVSNVFSMMMSDKKAQMLPDSYYNNDAQGDLLVPQMMCQPSIYPMSIKRNKARQIDEYFTRYGYAINELEVPNITHRSNYNYIRVSSDSTPCIINNYNNITIPQNDLDIINNLFRNGITIWHNHTNLGDYSVSNTIV